MMKYFTKASTKLNLWGTYAATLILGMLIFSSCKKTETAVSPSPYLSIYNASPSAATYNVYVSDVQVNSAALPLGGGIAYRQYAAGDYAVKFTTASSIASLLTKTISISDNNIYSYFLINTPGNLDALLVTDDVTPTSATKAFIRFVNLSPDAPALDLVITSGASLFKNQAYKAASGFSEIDPATYSFDIKDNITGVVNATLAGTKLIAGLHYTVISKGLFSAAGTDQAIALQVLTNK